MVSSLLLSVEEQQTLLTLSRRTLNELYANDPEWVLSEFEKQTLPRFASLKRALPCFVTLLTDAGMLRGCIGTTQTEAPLYENVFLYTRFAATEDPRFPPVEPRELEKLKIEISVLGPLHALALKDINSLSIGKHGLVVRNGRRSGLLLAKVATEYSWTPQQFLKHTCEKAGLPPEHAAEYQLSYFEELSF